MLLLISVFISILAITFGVVMLASGPTRHDKRVEQRLAVVHAGAAHFNSTEEEASSLLRQTSTSHLGWLEESFEKYPVWKNLQKYVAQSGLKSTASGVLAQMAALTVVGPLVALIALPMLPVEIGAACLLGSLPWIRIAWARSRRIHKFNEELPGAIDTMARALRAGHAMAGAIEMVADSVQEPASFEFREVFRQQNFGLPLREALLQMTERVPSPDLRVLVTAIIVQRETGGNLVEVMDRTVFLIRERQRIQGDIKIQTAQGRLTGWILSLMPIGMMGLINLVSPGYSNILFTDPFGRELLYVGSGLIVLGAIIIRKIVNGVDV
jgi:tight adherence protein B